MVTGFIEISGNTYYFNPDTYKQETGKITIANNSYYFDKNTAILLKNWITDDNNTYHSNDQGLLDQGFVTINNNTYYFNENTNILETGWITINNSKYFANNLGIIQTGITTIDNNKYYLDNTNGKLLYGFITSPSNDIYYSNDQGIIETGIVTIGNIKYLFNSEGILESGFKTIANNTYYYDVDGHKLTGLNTIGNTKYLFSPEGVLLHENVSKVIDVSSHQKTINWHAVSNSDIDGAIIRLGYGTSYSTETGTLDSKFLENYYNSLSYNLLRGIYLYSYAIDTNSAKEEAKFVVNNLLKYNVPKNITIYYDLESNNWTQALTTNDYDNIIKTFLTILNNAGYQAKIYTYKYLAETKLSSYARSNLTWIAQYYKECTYKGNYNGWQYTSTGSIPGIDGNVDISLFWQ